MSTATFKYFVGILVIILLATVAFFAFQTSPHEEISPTASSLPSLENRDFSTVDLPPLPSTPDTDGSVLPDFSEPNEEVPPPKLPEPSQNGVALPGDEETIPEDAWWEFPADEPTEVMPSGEAGPASHDSEIEDPAPSEEDGPTPQEPEIEDHAIPEEEEDDETLPSESEEPEGEPPPPQEPPAREHNVPAPLPPGPEQSRTVAIVVNIKNPASVELGQYYAARRGIPVENICRLSVTSDEEIDWEIFRHLIRTPLREFLKDKPHIRYIVTTYGIPVSVRESDERDDGKAPGYPKDSPLAKFMVGRDYCSVDSELAAINMEHEERGWTHNDYYAKSEPISHEFPILIVCRLDGPSPKIARELVDRAITAETQGISGKAYIDAQGITKGPYLSLDKDLILTERVLKEFGIECVLEKSRGMLGQKALKEPLYYWGWRAPKCFLSRDFKFPIGAIAVHLHENSSRSLRSTRDNWTGPLLARGVTGTIGVLNEPLMEGYPNAYIFFQRFLKGYTFGEAAYMSLRYVSWQSVVVGDPLYQPYHPDHKIRRQGARDKQQGPR